MIEEIVETVNDQLWSSDDELILEVAKLVGQKVFVDFQRILCWFWSILYQISIHLSSILGRDSTVLLEYPFSSTLPLLLYIRGRGGGICTCTCEIHGDGTQHPAPSPILLITDISNEKCKYLEISTYMMCYAGIVGCVVRQRTVLNGTTLRWALSKPALHWLRQ